MTSAELSERQVIDIDIASDEVAADKYRACEDPTLVASAKTQRGPLDRLHWRENARRAQQPLMCVYKVVRAEFRYFGMQSAIEGTIQRSQREMFLNGHRQLFAWMDEWIDLSVAQIREYERETVRLISAQMGTAAEASSPAPPSSSDSDANAANSADADESPVSLDPMVNGTEQWESLWRACGTFLPTLGRYDARTPALPVASSPSSLASSPLSRNNRGGSMFARGEQPPNVLSSAAWTMPLAIADASYQFDARSMIRSLNAWPQRIQFLHQCMQEGAMAEASRSLSLPLARRLIAGLIRDAPRLIRSVVPGASEGSNENACFSPSVTAAASVPSVPIVHSDSAQGGSGSDSGGTLHLQCHHAHASVTLPSLSVPALLAHVYAHFMAEDFNGSATKLFSAAQRAAIWQALPRPVPVRGAEPSVATSESDLHALKTSRRERLSRVLFEFTESVSINGRVVNRNHNGRRRGRYGRNLSLGDSGAGQRRAIHVSSADHAADAFVSGDDESDMTDERSSGSSSDNDEDNDDMEVEDEADTEEFWRWHPLLMRAMMQTTVELPMYEGLA